MPRTVQTYFKKAVLAPGLMLVMMMPSILDARLPNRIADPTPRDYWQFIFLLEQTRTAGQSEFIIHPFYSTYLNEEKAYDYNTALYPIFYNHGTNHWRKWSLLYFITGDDVYHEDSKEDTDFFLTPFFQLGLGDSADERYFSVFPIYGTMRDKFGWSEFNYALWPLWSSWSRERYKAYSILWPLIMWGGSPSQSDFRFLPIYSSKKHFGKFERKTALWPFFQWGSEALDKRDPRHYFFSFPLYGRKWSDSGDMEAQTFLWLPLLGGLFAYGSDERRNATDFNALFFLYQYASYDDPTIRKHIIFPFYGYYRFGAELEDENDDNLNEIEEEAELKQPYHDRDKLERRDSPFYKEATFITPLYAHLRTNSAVLQSDYHILAPFYWDNERFLRRERRFEHYNKFWPLYVYTSNDNGRREFRTLTLWPFRSDQFERAWGTLYSIFEMNHYENGDRFYSFLLRAYSWYGNDLESHHFLLGFEWHNAPDYWSAQFLGGLLGYRRDYPHQRNNLTESSGTLSLFWIDL